jgi:hypothetical protein
VCIITTVLHRRGLCYLQLRDIFLFFFRLPPNDAEIKNALRFSSAPTYMFRYFSNQSETFTFHTSTSCKGPTIIIIWFQYNTYSISKQNSLLKDKHTLTKTQFLLQHLSRSKKKYRKILRPTEQGRHSSVERQLPRADNSCHVTEPHYVIETPEDDLLRSKHIA